MVPRFLPTFGRKPVFLALLVAACSLATTPCPTCAEPTRLRIATFNTSLNRAQAGNLVQQLSGTSQPAQQVAAIIQQVRPDVLLLNEFDWDAEGQAAALFRSRYLAVGQFGNEPLEFPYAFLAPVNTGVLSGLDLDGDGRLDGPQDAFGFGRFPGQYGMLVLSRYPIDPGAVRTFQNFLWKDLPQAQLPHDPTSETAYYSPQATHVLRLSSKSHWDVPIRINDATLHFLVAHPTPPVFDGPEDRNGRRNHDEIRFWLEYLAADAAQSQFIYDDRGVRGGLGEPTYFVVAGDLNSDPYDGDSRHEAIQRLLAHPQIQSEPAPSSRGGVAASSQQQGANRDHQGNPAYDTSDFSDRPGSSGNLRVDYVLPSKALTLRDAGIFWPIEGEQGADWIQCSDHRLVWIDVTIDTELRGGSAAKAD